MGGRVIARAPAYVRSPSSVNHAPRFASLPPTKAWVGGHFFYAARAIDDEGTTLSFAPVRLPKWMRLDHNGVLSGKVPALADSYAVALQVTDGNFGLATQRFTLVAKNRPRLRIVEVLADPPSGMAGDANGDELRQTWADEFVEILNDSEGTVDLAGWRLTDTSQRRPYVFPLASQIPSGKRHVVFGADAGGRLGDGLGNRRDAVYLIDPAGPETLASVHYQLDKDPDQSLIWERDVDTAQRYSVGQFVRLQPMIRYSDGAVTPLPANIAASGSWQASGRSARVDGGLLEALAPGSTRVTLSIDKLLAMSDIDVRRPLRERLTFAPSWTASRVPAGTELSFAVQAQGESRIRLQWRQPGHSRITRGQQFRWRRSTASTDTIRVVATRPGGAFEEEERVEHTWLLQSNRKPTLTPPADSLLLPGQTYLSSCRPRTPMEMCWRGF